MHPTHLGGYLKRGPKHYGDRGMRWRWDVKKEPVSRIESIAQDPQADSSINLTRFERELEKAYSQILSEPLPEKLLETIEAIRIAEKRNAI